MSLNLIVEIKTESSVKKMILPRVSAGLTSRAVVCKGDFIQFGALYQVHIEDVTHSFKPTDSPEAPITTLEGRLTAWGGMSPQDISNDLRDFGFKDML